MQQCTLATRRWNFRRYPGPKLLIKPSKAAVGKHRRRLADETRRLRGANAGTVIATLNPVIRGWTAYHRGMVSAAVFGSLGHHTWTLTWKWARWTHPNKGGWWVASRYYGRFCPSRDDKWVFGDRGTGAYLLNHAWTNIRRHVVVKGRSSPDDPDLAGYWENRRGKKHGLAAEPGTLALLTRQENRCPHCTDPLIDLNRLPSSPEDWEHWWLSVVRRDIPRAASAPGTLPPGQNETTLALMHASCSRSRKAAERRNAA